MDKFFALHTPFLRFARNIAVVSCLGLIPILLLYVALTPGFGDMLLEGGHGLARFLRQIVTNGLPVVFVVNYLSFFLYALLVANKRGAQRAVLVLLIDLPARVAIFIILHAVIYLVSADWFDSFGGDRLTALRVVAPTLARSALFENISGVYLYATLVSALPLYATALARYCVEREASHGRLCRLIRRLPGMSGPILLALGLFALFVLALTAVAAGIVRLQSS